MALTPEEVINKRFQATKFKEGYNPEEVDDFLDEIVIELRRLNAENSSLKRQLEDAENRASETAQQQNAAGSLSPIAEAPAPVVEQPTAGSAGSANAASLLAMAQKVHDDYVAEGQREKDRLMSEAREEAATMLSSAEEERTKLLGDLETSREQLEASVSQLRGFEQQYRAGLRSYLEQQLTELQSETPVADSLQVQQHDGEAVEQHETFSDPAPQNTKNFFNR